MAQAAADNRPYLNCFINGYSVTAMVGSASQVTAMSKQCAERCRIFNRIDKRGKGRIFRDMFNSKLVSVGRLNDATIAIGSANLTVTFTVFDLDMGVDIIIGTDVLEQYGCVFDNANKCLHITVKAPFLTVSDPKPSFRFASSALIADDGE